MDLASASDLNAHWAAERLPYQLDRRGVANLWVVCPAASEARQPILFIIGNERRAVAQARRWAETLHDKVMVTIQGELDGAARVALAAR